ncbi:TonB-dependent receptor plug domain-containing protein [Taibaiella sp. KBW10]|uniref:TonB-dependent receptor plug domain-containing protein n=1 Tax=Taibaiella sp. KBW10 TaxID=2153357 RepID=UPI000F58FD14|nr:TonB-dependent receptor plug domain-containing protein [Taibaiella sp. KBW10]
MGQVFYDTLKNVQVTEQKKQFNNDLKAGMQTGQTRDTISSLTLRQYQQFSLATLLSQQTTVFVKSYGINSMATLSFRGASSAQSAVLWKGVPILNPALGVSDVSMLQTGLFDKITLQYGSNAALLGSGNIGGALLLDNQQDYPKQNSLKLGLGMGSYGRKEGNVQALWQSKKWIIKWNAFGLAAKNNFRFVNNNQETEATSHADLKAFGSILATTYKIDPTQHISLDLWYQRYYREIPKALFESQSSKEQTDAAFRSLLHWEKQHRLHTFYAKFSLNKEYLKYTDTFYQINTQNTVNQYYQELGWKNTFQLRQTAAQHTVLVTLPFQYVAIRLLSGETYFQNRPALTGTYRYTHGHQKLSLQANIRQEWNQGKALPLLSGTGIHYDIVKNTSWQIGLNGTIQRTYRLPTLNELYNFPGGNQELKPEQGWNREVSYTLSWSSPHQKVQVDHQLNYFNRHIKDWIYWLGGAIWTPHNIAQVHNRGLESNNTLRIQISAPVQLQLGLKTAYILSTTEQSYIPNDNSIGKQIPYTPRYNGQVNIGLHWKELYLNYNHTYTGYRFVTTDESQFTLPYQTGNVQALYSFPLAKVRCNASVQVQNIWNARYVVIAQRPMPQRYVVAGLQFEL